MSLHSWDASPLSAYLILCKNRKFMHVFIRYPLLYHALPTGMRNAGLQKSGKRTMIGTPRHQFLFQRRRHMDVKKIGAFIAEQRRLKQLTQKQLGEALGIRAKT